MVVAPYISRVLGAEGIGIYSYNNSVSNYFLMIAMLGLANYGVREIALCKNRAEKKGMFSEIYLMQIITSIISIIAYLIACVIMKNSYSIIFMIYVVSGLFDVSWYFFGKENFKAVVIPNCIFKIIFTILIFTTVKTGNNLALYCVYMCLMYLVPNLVIWLIAIRDFQLKKVEKRRLKVHFKSNFLLFVPIIAISIYKMMDKIMLGLLVDYSNVGLYENAEKLISAPMGFITALGFVMIPKISSNIVESKSTREYIPLSMKYVAFIISPIIFGVFAISKYFIPIFYGNEFYESHTILNILIVSILFLGWANIIRTQILIPHKMDEIYIKSVFLGAIANVIMNLILIFQYKAIGVSIATVISEMVVCVYQSIKIRGKEVMSIRENVVIFMRFLLPALLMYVSVVFWELDNIYLNLCVKSLVCASTYIVLCILFNKNDFLLLVKSLKSVLKKV